MGRKSYLGGHTVIGPRTNTRQLDNTAPTPVPKEPHEYPTFIDGRIAENLRDELDGDFSFDTAKELAVAVDACLNTGSLEPIVSLARENDQYHYGNYILRLANKLLTGRQFARAKGQILVKGTGEIGWRREQLKGLHDALRASFDPECDEMPEFSATFLRAVRG